MPKATAEEQRAYQREWIMKRRTDWIKANGPCAHCGSWERPEVDHIDPSTKAIQPRGIWGLSQAKRDAELAKCQVLCYGCHLQKSREELERDPEHGTRARYLQKRAPCRCDTCRAASATYERERRRRLRVAGRATIHD